MHHLFFEYFHVQKVWISDSMPGREVLEPVFYLLPVTNELTIPNMSSPFLNLLTFKYKSPDLRTTASAKSRKGN